MGHGIHELKIDYEPGYQICFKQQGSEIIILLCGGDKSSQSDDIKVAKKLTTTLEV